jgi:hypothetical protein
MIGNRQLAILNAVVLAAALVAIAHAGRLQLPVPVVTWSAIAPMLACPFLVPPDCIEPLPGL